MRQSKLPSEQFHKEKEEKFLNYVQTDRRPENNYTAQNTFVSDHLYLNELLDKYQSERKKGLNGAVDHLQRFECALERHIECEELTLFPAARKHGDAKLNVQVDMLEEEHVEIRDRIKTLKEKLVSAGMDCEHEEMQLIYKLGEHNAREEYHVYPRLGEIFSEAETRQVEKALATPLPP